MSYEYKVFGKGCGSSELYFYMKSAMDGSPDYLVTDLNDSSLEVKYRTSESGWGADIELFIDCDEVFLNVHSGNAKKLLSYIKNFLSHKCLAVDFEEI